jgi:hypothetical protein
MAEDYRFQRLKMVKSDSQRCGSVEMNNGLMSDPFDFLGESGVCKKVEGKDELPSVVKPPVVRDELPAPSVPETSLEEHFDKLTDMLQSVYNEMVLARTGSLPAEGGVPGEGMYYVTDEVAIKYPTANPPPDQVIDPDRISYDTLTNVSGPASDGYQRERIHDSIGRNATKATVINDGTATIYSITSINGRKWSPPTPILPGEARTFINVWELRLRCAVAGNLNVFSGGVYRVTEYDFWLSYVRIISIGPPNVNLNFSPTSLVAVQNVVQPAAGVPILPFNIVPINAPTTFRIMVAMSNVGNFSVIIENGGNTQVLLLNAVGGPAIAANSLYTFDILISAGDSVNFSYSIGGGTVQVLKVQEIDAAVT